ncbi:SMI1/KNR4 family protein [Pseudomonas fulva]|uniref:SMI1/KNR4 family protein n=1 Tax=Pseudomonas fulva TaxID=47880 RepID=UPI0034621E30
MDNNIKKRIESLTHNDSDLRGRPATEKEIGEAEATLNVKFNTQYIEFIKHFGGAFAGISIHAFNNGEMIGDETVTTLTQNFRTHTYGLTQELNDSYVISDDGSGNPILINNKGQILIYLHETGETEILHESFNQLLDHSLPNE